MVPDLVRHHADFTYFTFRSIIYTDMVDINVPTSYLSLELSIRSSQTLSNSVSDSDVLPKTPVDLALVTSSLKFIEDFSLKLGVIPMTSFLRWD